MWMDNLKNVEKQEAKAAMDEVIVGAEKIKEHPEFVAFVKTGLTKIADQKDHDKPNSSVWNPEELVA